MELTENQLLNYALENGMIDLDTIQTKIEMNERKKYLEQHEFTKWKGSDGKYHTYVPDMMNERGRKEIKRSSIESLDDAIIKHYKEQEEVIRVKEVLFNVMAGFFSGATGSPPSPVLSSPSEPPL